MKLGQILVNKNLISTDLLHQITKQQPSNLPLGEFLVQKNLISSDVLALALKEQYWRNNGYWVID